jgi:hypothetical protein
MTELEKEFSAKGFANEMRRIQRAFEDTPDQCHALMDECMCHLLRELGYGEGIDIYEDTERWYS